MNKRPKSMTLSEARSAIYVDFEQCKDEDPILLGVLFRADGGKTVRYVRFLTDADFRHAVSPGVGGFEPPKYRELSSACRYVLRMAEREDRLIVSWSEHDLRVMHKGLKLAEHPALEQRYRDGKAIVKRWANSTGQGHEGRNTLASYPELIGYEVPEGAGTGRTGETIRRVRKSLTNKSEGFADLTPNQQARWLDLLEHNRHDCLGMRDLVFKAAKTQQASC